MSETKLTKEKEEILLLKERAKDLGIKVAANIKLEELRELVNAQLKPVNTKSSTSNELRRSVYQEAMKLVRVRVVCMNPNKKEWTGEYFSAANSIVPFVTRMVPYNEVTHVENILFEAIKNREIAYVAYEKNGDGVPFPKRKMRKEFQVELLPQLTDEELESLRIDQSKRVMTD